MRLRGFYLRKEIDEYCFAVDFMRVALVHPF